MQFKRKLNTCGKLDQKLTKKLTINMLIKTSVKTQLLKKDSVKTLLNE